MWRVPTFAKDHATDQLVNVCNWVCLPLSLADGLFQTGWLDLSRFPCNQANC